MRSKSIPAENISDHKKESVKNLYLSGISIEFVAMQIDLSTDEVVGILKELGIYQVQ
ncbi:MAG: hypothetical protein KGI27_05055 [Thaumarchaeota archaeon]|nr:hypothetical protein [Nitrososphaerota archaeon]